MNYNIVIDNREHKLIKYFEDSIVKQLDIGDIHLYNADNNECICIIERKTLDDFSSSIIDGRYREQKQRLLSSNKKIIYIIEGDSKNNFGVKYSTLQSAMLNMQLRDNIIIIRTKNIEETSNYIILLKTKTKYFNDNETTKTIEYNSNINVKKKNNLTYEQVFINQLSCIPGISSKISKDIQSQYKSLNVLIDAYNNLESDDKREKMLCSINGIGKKISYQIFSFIYKIL